jgi:hypothetical protein
MQAERVARFEATIQRLRAIKGEIHDHINDAEITRAAFDHDSDEWYKMDAIVNELDDNNDHIEQVIENLENIVRDDD